MADIVVIPMNVGSAFELNRIRSFIAGSAIVSGSPVYIDVNGLAQPTNASAVSTASFAGIALVRQVSGFAAGPGQAVEVLQEGEIEGFVLSGIPYGAPVYLSNTLGTLATGAGTHGSGAIGIVVPTSDRDGAGNIKKLLRVRDPINSPAV